MKVKMVKFFIKFGIFIIIVFFLFLILADGFMRGVNIKVMIAGYTFIFSIIAFVFSVSEEEKLGLILMLIISILLSIFIPLFYVLPLLSPIYIVSVFILLFLFFILNKKYLKNPPILFPVITFKGQDTILSAYNNNTEMNYSLREFMQQGAFRDALIIDSKGNKFKYYQTKKQEVKIKHMGVFSLTDLKKYIIKRVRLNLVLKEHFEQIKERVWKAGHFWQVYSVFFEFSSQPDIE